MNKGTHRRNCRRFNLPGAQVRVKKSGLTGLVSGMSNPQWVLNLSKGGIAFASEERLPEGQKISLQLLIPDEEPVTVHGSIAWQGRSVETNEIAIGVAFEPFGIKKNQNSKEALELLRRLDKRYGQGPEADSQSVETAELEYGVR